MTTLDKPIHQLSMAYLAAVTNPKLIQNPIGLRKWHQSYARWFPEIPADEPTIVEPKPDLPGS
jgi:hypothetical protein